MYLKLTNCNVHGFNFCDNSELFLLFNKILINITKKNQFLYSFKHEKNIKKLILTIIDEINEY